jgi:hypothetical protein
VKPIHPVVGKPEEHEPHKQHTIVDGCTPQQNVTCCLDLHFSLQRVGRFNKKNLSGVFMKFYPLLWLCVPGPGMIYSIDRIPNLSIALRGLRKRQGQYTDSPVLLDFFFEESFIPGRMVSSEGFRNTPKPLIPLIGLVQPPHSKKAEMFAPTGFLHKYQSAESVKQDPGPKGFMDEKYRVHPIYIPCVLLDALNINENLPFEGGFSRMDFPANSTLRRRKATCLNQRNWIRSFRL